MPINVPIEALQSWITKLELRERDLKGDVEELSDKLRETQRTLYATTECLDKMRDALAVLTPEQETPIDAFDDGVDEPTKPNPKQFDRIVAFLEAKKNMPQTIAEIEQGTGIPRTSISAVLYRTHHEFFVGHDIEGKRGKAWRLSKNQNEEMIPPSPGPGEEDIPF